MAVREVVPGRRRRPVTRVELGREWSTSNCAGSADTWGRGIFENI